LPAAAEICIGQFHITAVFLDMYFSWCILHRKYISSELNRLLPALLLTHKSGRLLFNSRKTNPDKGGRGAAMNAKNSPVTHSDKKRQMKNRKGSASMGLTLR